MEAFVRRRALGRPRPSTPDQFEETMTLLRELEEAMRDIPEVVPTAPSNQAG